jgi:hypothetical protein
MMHITLALLLITKVIDKKEAKLLEKELPKQKIVKSHLDVIEQIESILKRKIT